MTRHVHLYLDVDGVLNAVSWFTPDWGWPDDRQSLVGGFPIRWSEAMVARVQALADRADVRPHWLTTWGERAPRILCPALGIDGEHWPVVGDREREREIDTVGADSSGWWKLDAIRAHLPAGTPAVWVDDDLKRVPAALDWVERRGDVLGLSPATEVALTPAHLDQATAFVDSWAQTSRSR